MSTIDFLYTVSRYRPGDVFWLKDHGWVTISSIDYVAERPSPEGKQPNRPLGIYWAPETAIIQKAGVQYACPTSLLSREPPTSFDGLLPPGPLSKGAWEVREQDWGAFQEDFPDSAQVEHMRVSELPRTRFREGDRVNCKGKEGEWLVEEVDYVQIAFGRRLPRIDLPKPPFEKPYICRKAKSRFSCEADQLTLVSCGPNWR